jgi:chromosomal replication initiation ATPase DnaA
MKNKPPQSMIINGYKYILTENPQQIDHPGNTASDAQHIMNICMEEFGINTRHIAGGSRVRKIARAKMAISGVLRKYTNLTHKDIAGLLSLKCHTTVVNHVSAFKKLMTTNLSFGNKVRSVEEKINNNKK